LFFKARQGLYRDFYAKADVAVVSDDAYVVDFDEFIPDERLIDAKTMRQLESSVFGGRNWSRFNLLAEFSYIDDLTVEEHRGTLQRVPTLEFVALKQRLPRTPLYFRWDTDYTRFWRREGLRGQRLNLHPRLSFPLMVMKAIRLEAEAGFREILYLPSNGPRNPLTGERILDEFESREIPDFTASTSTILSRIFEGGWWKIDRWKHQIEPEISYTYIPRVDQDDVPIFDDLDRIDYTNAITYGLTNTLSGRIQQAGGGHANRELLRFTLFQSYSFGEPFWREARTGRGRYFSDIKADLWLDPSRYITFRGDLEYDVYKRYVEGLNVLAALSDKRGDTLGLQYLFTRDEVENIDVKLNVRILDSLDLFTAYSYNIFEKRRFYTLFGLEFRAKCWGVRLSVRDIKGSSLTLVDGVPTRRIEDETKFRIQFILAGIGSVGL
jgi:LPS-assembly protein